MADENTVGDLRRGFLLVRERGAEALLELVLDLAILVVAAGAVVKILSFF